MARMERGKAVPWAAAVIMWGFSITDALGARRALGVALDRLVNTATVCVTLWAIIATYHYLSGDRLGDAERRLDAYDEAWGQVHENAEAQRRRERMRSGNPPQRDAS